MESSPTTTEPRKDSDRASSEGKKCEHRVQLEFGFALGDASQPMHAGWWATLGCDWILTVTRHNPLHPGAESPVPPRTLRIEPDGTVVEGNMLLLRLHKDGHVEYLRDPSLGPTTVKPDGTIISGQVEDVVFERTPEGARIKAGRITGTAVGRPDAMRFAGLIILAILERPLSTIKRLPSP